MKNKLFKSLLVLIMMIGVFATVNNFSVEDIKAATNAVDAPDDWAFTEDSIPLHDAILDNYGSIDTGDGQGGSPDGYISKDEAAAYTGTIELNGSGITGTLDGIEKFTAITQLRLQNNELTGSIPENIGDMKSLVYLYLNGNQLTGEIPTSIGELENVSYLYLHMNQLSGSIPSSIGNLTKMRNLYLQSNKLSGTIPSELGNPNSTNFSILRLDNNQLTGSIPQSLANLTILTVLQLNGNQLSGEVSGLGTLNSLTTLHLSNNKITSIDTSMFSGLTSLQTFSYQNNDIQDLDLSNLSPTVTSLAITTAKNLDMSNIQRFLLSGTNRRNSYVKLTPEAGAVSWNTSGYYILASDKTVLYSVDAPYLNDSGEITYLSSQNMILSEGGLMDKEGKIIVGATINDIVNGEVVLENGGTVITPLATYTFDKATTVGETEITTEGTITIANNTTDGSTVTVGDITTIVKVPEGSEATISLDSTGGTVNAPAGSVVTNNDGSETYLTGEGTVKEDGTITSSEKTITVPTDKLNDVAVDGSEITFPAGVIVDDGSTSITYPGTIIYDTDDNTLTYLPVDGLFNEDGTLKKEVTQEDITNAQDFVTGLDDSALKTELQSKVEDAQNQLNERNAEKAVDDLFETDGKIKDAVTQEDIDNAKDLVDNLNDGDKKTELQDKLEDAQNQLNERNAEKAVDDLFDKDGNIKDTVTHDDIDNAQNLVNELPEGQLKDELNDKLKEAQKQLDEKNFVIIEAFKVFTGEGTVYTKIDAPVEKFSSISVDGKELDASNYEVTSGSTIITLSGAYLKTLDNGTYDVDVEFTSGAVVKTTLTVKVEGNPSKAPSTTNPNTYKPSTAAGSSTSSSTVDTGDTTNLPMLYALLASSLLGFVVITKKERNKTSK